MEKVERGRYDMNSLEKRGDASFKVMILGKGEGEAFLSGEELTPLDTIPPLKKERALTRRCWD